MTGPAIELRATYRLQLTEGFGFHEARELIPYLRDLGISHLYLSPSLQAREGSTHGYDVVDPSRFSEALGGDGGFRELSAAAHGAGLGIILDVVPNHMAADDANRFWRDRRLRQQFFDIDPVSGRHRRFFDIDDLAAIRIEDSEVFHATHDFVLRLVREGVVDGLRVDHPDGLADPAQYLERLRGAGALYVWVEKILSASDPPEHVRSDWAVSGTVGYEFSGDVCALFVDPAAKGRLTAMWTLVSGDVRGFGEWAHEAKLDQANGVFTPELERLARTLDRDASQQDVLVDAVARLPVYRTYVKPQDGAVAEEDRAAIHASGMDEDIARRLLLETEAPEEFVVRFQQTTPAIMAKGVEDTAFYRYCRLLALNDVGGDPSRFGLDVKTFHAANRERATRYPLNLLTTMTHDAKRSGDVRARIAALSWIPSEWASAIDSWERVSWDLRSERGAPDAIERYFIFQTLVGVWPIELERVEAYLEKALREAKRNSNWVDGDEAWENDVKRFARSLVESPDFLETFEPFCQRVARLGDRIARGMLTLKLTSPGVPDIYQGDELEFRALVDPDNRRPVDWHLRQAQLKRLMGGGHLGEDGRKLWITSRLLGLRARRPAPFAPGSEYTPLDAGDTVCAFLRGEEVLVIVPLREQVTGTLSKPPEGLWRDVLTAREHTFEAEQPLQPILGGQAVAVLERLR